MLFSGLSFFSVLLEWLGSEPRLGTARVVHLLGGLYIMVLLQFTPPPKLQGNSPQCDVLRVSGKGPGSLEDGGGQALDERKWRKSPSTHGVSLALLISLSSNFFICTMGRDSERREGLR